MESGKYWQSFLPIFIDRIGNVMRKRTVEVASKYELNNGQSTYLIALYLLNGPTSTQLSKFLDLDQGNTFRIVKQLVEMDLVYDDRKEEGTRNYRLYLTDKGKEAAEYIMNGVSSYLDESVADISDRDLYIMRRSLVRILMKVDRNVDSYIDNEFTNPFFSYMNVVIPNESGVDIIPRVEQEGEDEPLPAFKASAASHAAPLPKPSLIANEPDTPDLTFIIRKAAYGYTFSGYDGENEVLYSGRIFKMKKTCRDLIDKIKTMSNVSLNTKEGEPGPRFEIDNDAEGVACNLLDSSGELLLTSKTYPGEMECKADIARLRSGLPFARILEID